MNAKQLDLLIVGAGPAGLSAADAAAREGLDYLVVEKGLIAQTIFDYPIGRTVFSTPNELEMRDGALRPCREKPTREELLSHYVHFALEQNLRINTEEEVIDVEKIEGDRFLVRTNRDEYNAARILFAIGAMATARKLGVPGEDLPKVQHSFREPYPYVRKDVMVIGGGNSAAEAALFLVEEGANTTLTIWRSDWENRDPKKNAIKHWVRTPLEAYLKEGKLNLVLMKEVVEITKDEVEILEDGGDVIELPNDAVFVLIGCDADLSLLRKLGVSTEPAGFAEVPVYDPETFETNVAGIYVTGHFTHARHIKAAIDVPRRVIARMAQDMRQRT